MMETSEECIMGLLTVDLEQEGGLRRGRRGLRVQGQEEDWDKWGHKEGLIMGRGLEQEVDLGQWGSFTKGCTVDRGQKEQGKHQTK